MKRRYFQITQLILKNKDISQREIAKILKISLAYVNKIFFSMEADGLLNSEGIPAFGKKQLTQKAMDLYEGCKVDNAIIMAAGFGSRFVPLTYAKPKGLLKVFGERMIERQIEQLHKVGIKKIILVVGYLKETFEYLIDKYGVELVYNPEFITKNNLSTLYCVRDKLKNSFILSSDNWLRNNPYHSHEYDSWYSAVKVTGKTSEWVLRLGLHDKILGVKIGGRNAWTMYGPVYFSRDFSKKIVPLIEEAYNRDDTDNWYWEDVYRRNLKELTMYANKQPKDQVYEFESLEEIRLFDSSYFISSHNKWLKLIASIFNKKEHSINNLKPLKMGMTNKSFLFQVEGEDYIFRIPGEGTEILINRNQEYEVYQKIKALTISDTLIYIDPKTGVKITKFEKDTHNADAYNLDDVKLCMNIAKKLHNANLQVGHEFDFKERIEYYENIAKEKNSILYNDYEEVRKKMDELLEELKYIKKDYTLTHIDLVPDNCIIRNKETFLIDWEYAGMCDPLADISMFAIYSYYDENMLEQLMEIYFERKPNKNERIRIYIYIALAGFLWTLWTCYKQSLGVTFEDYGMKMYRYAKDYYKKVKQLLEEENENISKR